jgi:hypothetical protein
VAPPVALDMKGLSEPLPLYELRGLGGRFGHAVGPRADDAERPVDPGWSLACWRIDGKIVRPERLSGALVRLGRHRLVARLEVALPPLTNVRVRLDYPSLGRASDDLYGKVVGVDPGGDGRVHRIHLTSVTDADQTVIDTVLAASGGTA